MISCVAVVGPKSNPLHIQPLEDNVVNPLKFDNVVYVCLDAIENVLVEQAEHRRAAQQHAGVTTESDDTSHSPFLGLVSMTPEYHIYAHVMANFTKIIILVSPFSKPANSKLNEELATMCVNLELAFKRAVSNPFYTPGAALESEAFAADVRKIAEQHFNARSFQVAVASSAVP